MLRRPAAVEMPFAEVPCGIASGPQDVADGGESDIALRLGAYQRARRISLLSNVFNDAVGLGPESSVAAIEVVCRRHAGLEAATRRRAHGRPGIGMLEDHALLCEPLHVGHLAEGHRRTG